MQERLPLRSDNCELRHTLRIKSHADENKLPIASLRRSPSPALSDHGRLPQDVQRAALIEHS